MALSLGTFITAAEAKAMLDSTVAVQAIKIGIHQTIASVAHSVTNIIYSVPKSISADAQTALEAEGFTVTVDVLPAGQQYDNFTIDWSNA
jgi:hypothetical protein